MKFNENLEAVLHRLGKGGAFLTVKNGERVNTMTIGWGLIGIQWQLPMFTVLVRPSRFTFGLIDTALDFTVSVPKNDNFSKALTICGSKSGRDTDKFEVAGLVTKPSQKVATPVIAGDLYNYECRITYKTPLNPTVIPNEIVRACYPINDFHTLYFGEIVSCYDS
ncbi:MAG: flavin reductase family protein [Planctomycetaceae bacterium]|jgi:flavin reductase (DIM6/NTAB) family NADH-FMN oxidoreductase RutF|nr:flavin reductase family protein [Planctomycetaceae bacterium]